MNNFRRRDTFKLGFGLGAALAGPWVLAQNNSPIRIGLNLPLSGPISNIGQDLLAGAELAASQINRAGGLLGRQVELIARDDKASPTQAVANVREFTGSGINLIVGNVPTTTVLAVLPALEQGNAVQVTLTSVSMSLSHEKFSRHLFRAATNDYMQMRAYAALAVELYPNVTRWTCMNVDLETSLQTWDMFKKAATVAYEGINKQVSFAEPIISKFGASDFKNQVAAAMRSDAEGILQLVFGQGAVTLFQQGKALGLQDKFKVTLDRGNDPTFAKALGPLLPRQCWMVSAWHPEAYRNVPSSAAFEKEAAARLKGGAPGGFHFLGHLGVSTIAAGVRGARTTDTAAVIQALETTPVESAVGPLRFRGEDHQILNDVNFIQVEGVETGERYRVVRNKRYPAADYVQPANPGKPFVW